MKILTIHRYFWPDSPPYATKLRKLAESFSEQGHDVQVFSTQPGYKAELENPRQPKREALGQIQIHRCSLFAEKSRSGVLRAINSLLFCVKLFCFIVFRRQRFDVVMCSTMPPVFCGWTTSVASWLTGAKFIYHVMDIWPEVALHSGQMKQGVAYRILERFESAACRRAAKVVCLSQDMVNTYLQRKGLQGLSFDRSKLVVINNFELPDYDEANHQNEDVDPALIKPAGKFRVLFGGNIGKYQSLDTVIEAAHLLKDHSQIEFAFMGEGSEKAHLQELAGELLSRSVVFLPHQKVSVAKQVMSDSDLCLVSLSPNIVRVACPSKTLTYLALGCPILVVAEKNSGLSRMVDENRLGFCSESDDPDLLAANILHAANHSSELGEMGRRCRNYSNQNLTAEIVLNRWHEVLSELDPETKSSLVLADKTA